MCIRDRRFQLPVYGQRVPQGAKKPCFTVELKETEQKRLLGRRAARKAVFEVTYYCGEEKAAAAERAEALDGLYAVSYTHLPQKPDFRDKGKRGGGTADVF